MEEPMIESMPVGPSSDDQEILENNARDDIDPESQKKLQEELMRLTDTDQSDLEGGAGSRPDVDINSLTTKQYLDATVVPIILQGLTLIAQERPPKPIEYLVAYMMRHKEEYE